MITSIEVVIGSAGIAGPPGPTGPQGDQGIQGPPGVAGTRGATIFSGPAPPASTLLPQARAGDFYLQLTTNIATLFGPLSGGSWGTGMSLIGPSPSPYMVVKATAVSFNAVADTSIVLPTLPPGFTRARCLDLTVSHASAAIAAAAVGLFTNTGGGGIALVPSTVLSSITATTENALGNSQRVASSATTSIQPSSLPVPNTLQLRNTVAQGTAVTADVTIILSMLP